MQLGMEVTLQRCDPPTSHREADALAVSGDTGTPLGLSWNTEQFPCSPGSRHLTFLGFLPLSHCHTASPHSGALSLPSLSSLMLTPLPSFFP